MKTNLTRMIILAAAIAICAGAAFAGEKTVVNIPFSFRAGGADMPAGDYTITKSSPATDQSVMQITSVAGRKSTFLLAKNSGRANDRNMRINFHCVENACSLSSLTVGAGFAWGDARPQFTGQEAVRIVRDQRPEGE